jgi:hypothetical protein
MEKTLLVETNLFTPELFTENVNGIKLTKVRGMYQQANVVNANKRIYRQNILEREIAKLQNKIESRSLFSQLDHPSTGEITLKDVCALTTKLQMDGDKVVGESEILTTPNGNLLKELFNCRATVGVSSRAMGSVFESTEVPGCLEVAQDLDLICWDFVGEPSVGGCVMTLAEAKQKYLHCAKSYGLKDIDTKKALIQYIKQITGE